MSENDIQFVPGNYFDKYRSRSLIHRRLVSGFHACANRLLNGVKFDRVIEIGCGPGDLAAELFLKRIPSKDKYLGFDLSASEIELATQRYPTLFFSQGSAYGIPVESGSADLVICCEVLEHLDSPDQAIEEISRITRRWCLISVPHEPIWRILNVLRGKYLLNLGNTPGHLQHFTRDQISKLVERNFSVTAIKSPFPWTMILAEKHQNRTCGVQR